MGETGREPRYKSGYDDGFGELLDVFPEAAPRSLYPWAVWRDGQPRVLRRGKHFRAENATGMRSTVYAYARRHDIAVKVRLGRADVSLTGEVVFEQQDRFLTLQFFPGRAYGH